MKFLLSLIGVSLVSWGLSACAPSHKDQTKDERYFQEQQEQQGYPVLVAIPMSADYGLPFCETAYCLDIEIFGFQSQDQWFNQEVDRKIADLIRQELTISQKLSLQQAVNEFVRLSDDWQLKNTEQPWSIYIQPRVVLQQGEITVLEIQTEYKIADRTVPQQLYYFVLDRKLQKTIQLYDLIDAHSRIEFGVFLQEEYQKWRSTQAEPQKFSEKIYWGSQDWFFDEHTIGVYYRAKDLTTSSQNENLTIHIPKTKLKKWLNATYLQQFNLN